MARNKLIPYRPDLKEKARKLRNESTYSEVLLWMEIKNRKLLGYQFHRQVPMLNYIVDFYCHELMLAIEVDGDSHSAVEAKAYDLKRQQRLEAWCTLYQVWISANEKEYQSGGGNYKVLDNRKGVTPPLPPLKGGRFNLDQLSDIVAKG